jgi:uncharacterized membrane protein
MKNLFLSFVLVLATITSFANTTTLSKELITAISVTEEYKEIAIDQVPEAVKKAVEKDYTGATIKKAYINEKNEYKLELTIGDEVKTVYANAEGYWLNK